jgi:ParB-like chromosome segregation protein Spo0J
VVIPPDRQGRTDRIAATIRHNRARGEHAVEQMSSIVRMLYEAGWPDEKIQAELGMDLDEVVRLKQLTGLAALFRDRDFSEAWEAEGESREMDPARPVPELSP